ncbi:MAG TPA: DUF1501 domain-containing protein [Verrucomicrobiae bacterium]|nr:DUF1501 domain-containing protein [Verrucomicrobiae bacterium]
MEENFRTRREFLKSGLVGGALAWTIPSFINQTLVSLHAEGAADKSKPILVVLQMAGGNDGLNTVVPITNDNYYRSRPTLSVKAPAALRLNGEFGLHPAMTGFKELYDAGMLSVVHGVGYPNPNRSHFHSTDIWQTASPDAAKTQGWIGRYFDNACKGADPTVGISVGRQMPLAFQSGRPLGISLENPESYRFASGDEPGEGGMSSESFYRKLNGPEMLDGSDLNSGGSIGAAPGTAMTAQRGSSLDFLERVALDAQVSSDKILAVTKRVKNEVTYPASQVANSLKLVARLIAGGLPTRVFYVSQGGYDTHTNQAPAQQRLLGEMTSAVKTFFDDLKAMGHDQRVMLMTFSEFGRRVSQNANNGTDHGAAAPMFLAGPKVQAGIAGTFPSLAPKDLLNGDIRFSTDFRSVYAGVLDQWLGANSTAILGRKFAPLKVIA